MMKQYTHLTGNNTLNELITHPAFRGFGHLLLPWNDRMDLDFTVFPNRQVIAVPQPCGRGYGHSGAQSDDRCRKCGRTDFL